MVPLSVQPVDRGIAIATLIDAEPLVRFGRDFRADELHHEHAQPLPNRAERRTQGTSRFAFARPGVNDQQSFIFRHRNVSVRRADQLHTFRFSPLSGESI